MFIRMFLYAETKKETIDISHNILLNLAVYIDKKNIIELELYWKIKGIYLKRNYNNDYI